MSQGYKAPSSFAKSAFS